MSDRIICIRCEAETYNKPGETNLYCHTCFTKVVTLLAKAALLLEALDPNHPLIQELDAFFEAQGC